MVSLHRRPNTVAPITIQIPAISANATILVPAGEVICPKCGLRNRPGAKFCKRDGQPLTSGATIVPPRMAAQSVARAAIRARPVQTAVQPARPAPAYAQANGSQAAYRLALQYMNSKNYAEAVNQFKQAQVPGNHSYEVSYNLGRAYRQYGQSVKDKDKNLFTENMKFAAEEFEQAISIKPDAVDAYFQVGMTYHDLGLSNQSLGAFKNPLKHAPADSPIYYHLATLSMD